MNDDQHARTELRRRAEQRAAADQRPAEALKSEELHRLIHELRVHQIELEMQNDELRRAQEEIESSRARYVNLYDLAPVAYYTIEKSGLIRESNLTGARLLGVERITLPRRNFSRFVAKKDQGSYHLLVQRLFETASPQRCEIKLTTGHGILFDVRMEATIAVSGDGNRVAHIVLVDITERRKAEEELKASREALRLANEGLEEKVKNRSEQLMNTVRQLEKEIERRSQVEQELTRRADQLRTLAGELTMAEQRERNQLAKILHDGLQQYLVAAKLQIGGLVEEAADYNLKKLAIEAEHLLEESIRVSRSLAAELSPPILNDGGLWPALGWLSRWMSEKHKLKVKMSLKMAVAPALTDNVKVLLFEAVRELLLNVVKHAGTLAATVELTQTPDNKLRITVSDYGIGFDASGSLTGEGRSGFGLYSIQERIGLIGGSFVIDCSPGKGASFTLEVPLGALEDSTSESLDKENPEPGPSRLGRSLGKTRILLVDDHPVMREGLARLLAQEPDFEVIGHAKDGQEAIEQAGTLRPDVVLMDISMPRMNGIESTKIIHQQHPDIRIIGLSLYSEEERSKEMLEAGAALYLTKSGSPADLKAAIRACMSKNPEEAKSTAESERMKN